jgi:lipoprotein-anchoring transpeptidase ErfK/SrfK
MQVVIDNDAVDQCATSIAAQFNTVGSTRTYTRADGKTVSVKGGDYGWKIDSASLVASIDAAVDGTGPTTIELPVLQSADAVTTDGNRDFGTRYIDVDLTEQHARFYDESGNIIWESDIVSGEGNSEHATPQGTWSLNLKQSPSTLIGEMTSAGVPEYETVVQYWMPFEGNAVGFHDATWQSSFGGTRYLEGYGSHGCINLPLGSAAELYNLIQVGDVVVVHE